MSDDDKSCEVTVRRDLEDLVPGFLENRRKDPASLAAALAAGNLDEVKKIASMMKAVGDSFGFARIEALGREIEEAAFRADLDALDAYIALYRDYLQRVRIRLAPA